MSERNARIQVLLHRELIGKSLPPAITFAVCAIMVFFYHFNISEYLWSFRLACIGVVMASVARFWVSQQKTPREALWTVSKLSIWLNTACWSVIFTLGGYELQVQGIDYCILILLMSFFTTASLVTLSYDPILFFPFQFLVVAPQIIITFMEWLELKNHSYLIASFMFVVALLYQLRQYKEFRSHLLERFGYMVDLENSVAELQESKTELVNKTVTLIQISKASALGEMAGGLAHEVNNSLQIILGSVQQLERNLRNDIGENPTYESKIDTTRKAIHKIRSVVEGLRHFSRQMDVGPREPSTLDEIVTRSLTFCQEFIKAHGIELHISQIPNVVVFGHPIQITQIIFNLIKNAYDAVDKLKPEDKWIKIDFEVSSSGVLVKVCNGGTKISSEVASKVFQPFFTTKDVGLGTGLSLSSSLGIAKEHQGDLYLDHTPKHTTFVLRLPIEPA